MKNTKWNSYRFDPIKQSRPVFYTPGELSVDTSKLEAAAKNPMEVKASFQNPTELQTEIYDRSKAVEGDLKKVSDAELTKIDNEMASLNQSGPNYAAQKAKLESQKNDVKQRTDAMYKKIWTIRDQAVAKLWQDVRARDTAKERAVQATAENLAKAADKNPELALKYKEAANWADTFANDDVTNKLSSTKVADYLNTEMTVDGKKVELKDYEVEDMSKAVATALHFRAANTGIEAHDPAVAFVAGLAAREGKGTWKDNGVSANDIVSQIAETSHDKPEPAPRSEAAKNALRPLAEKIVADQSMAPQVRGMLLARLATATDANYEAAIKEVNTQYGILQQVATGKTDNIGGYENTTYWKEAAVFGAGLLATPLTGVVGVAAQLGAVGSAAYKAWNSDENALINAMGLMQTVDKMRFTPRLTGIRADVEALEKNMPAVQAGGKGVAAETAQIKVDIDNLLTNPQTLDENAVSALEKRVKALKDGAVATSVAELKGKADKVNPVYNFFQVKVPVTDAEIDGLKGKSLAELAQAMSLVTSRLDQAMTDPVLMEAANARKTKANKDVELINKYKNLRDTFQYKAELPKDIPIIPNAYTVIPNGDPQALMNALKIADTAEMKQDYQIAYEYYGRLQQAIAAIIERKKNPKDKDKDKPKPAPGPGTTPGATPGAGGGIQIATDPGGTPPTYAGSNPPAGLPVAPSSKPKN